MANVTCDRCESVLDGARVTITTEASVDRGADVDVTKRWVLCRPCGEAIFDRIGEASPWVDDDFKTVVLPDEEISSQQAGGFAASLR